MKIQDANREPILALTCRAEEPERPRVDVASIAIRGATAAESGDPATAAQINGAIALLGSVDVMSLLRLAQMHLRDAKAAQSESTSRATAAAQEQANREMQAAIERAIAAANRTGGLLGVPVLGDLVKVVVVAAAAASAAVTGGVGGALAIVALVLILGADKIAEAAVSVGMISKEDAGKLALAIRVVGAALSLGSGFASTATSVIPMAKGTAQTIRTIADVIHGVLRAIEGVDQSVDAVHMHKSRREDALAEGYGLDAEQAEDALADIVADIKRSMNQHRRIQESLNKIEQARYRTRLAAVLGPEAGWA